MPTLDEARGYGAQVRRAGTTADVVAKLLIAPKVLDGELDDDELLEVTALFALWEPGVTYRVGDLRVDPSDRELYRCVQGYTAHDPNHLPSLTAALWTRVRNVGGAVDLWVQPTGGHDAYPIGAVVHWPKVDGQNWRSKINANTTRPDGDVPHNRYWEPIGTDTE